MLFQLRSGQRLTVVRRGEPNEDGSFDIVCRATSRYRTMEVIDDGPYLQARVELFDDDEDDEADPALQALVRSNFRSLVDLAASEAGAQIIDGQGAEEQAAKGLEEGDTWTIGQRLGMEAARQQSLLELTSENARLQSLAEHLEHLLPILEARIERKKHVKTNGHRPEA